MKLQPWHACILGIIIGGVGTYFFLESQTTDNWYDNVDIASEEHHTHADFLVYINGEQLDFTADKYQTTAENMLSETVHLHDNQGDVIHFHAEGVTLEEFFSSLGFTITNDCLTTDTGETHCTDGANVLELYVNGELVADIPNAELVDEDQKLLYFGTPNPPGLQTYLDSVSDRACIYSGTCPERGTPPPEECGLTCEL